MVNVLFEKENPWTEKSLAERVIHTLIILYQVNIANICCRTTSA